MLDDPQRRKKPKGVTLIEVFIVVAIIGMAIYLVKVGLQFINQLTYRTTLLKIQQEANLNLYGISRDIRNSKVIIHISSDTLVLQKYDSSLGYDTQSNPTIFDSVNLATVTYRFVVNGNDSFLLRTENKSGQLKTLSLLKNKLIPPTTSDYLFRHYQGVPIANPQAVDFCFRINPSVSYRTNLSFTATAKKRTRD